MKNTKMIALISALVLSVSMTACSSNEAAPAPAGSVSADHSVSALTPPTSLKGSPEDKTPAATEKNDVPAAASADAGIKEDADYAPDGDGDTIAAEAPAYSAKSDSIRAEVYPADGAEAYSPISPDDGYGETAPAMPETDGDVIMPPEPPQQQPEAGLLTAGEWKDNENWGFFTNLVNTDKISFPSYGVEPRFRTKVTVKNSADGQPAVNAKVSIYSEDDSLLWTAVTDKNGVAYLFTENADTEFRGVAEYGSAKTKFTGKSGTDIQKIPEGEQGTAQSIPDEQRVNGNSSASEIELTLDSSGAAYKKTDVMFILDATGSMGDEMAYIQKEFTDIAEKIGDENTRYSVNFYRDEYDEYVTKCFDFSDNVQAVQSLLNDETATGGGDAPEAVDKILAECIGSSGWSEDSVKIAFLIFDAPPHYGTEASLAASIQIAAEKGIRLIPVVASNSDRDTELFGRAIAIKTGGTYVFLTDDSGVGSSHLEPIIGKYDVEKLNDLIVRVINEYKQ